MCPLCVLCCACGVLGHLAPVHRCARSVRWVVCSVSSATRLLFTGVPARCVVLRVRCPRHHGFRCPMCSLGVVCRVCDVLAQLAPGHRCACMLCAACSVCGVLGHLPPAHRCSRSMRCVACAVSLATRLLLTGVPARCVALFAWCPWPLGFCSPVCPLGVLSAVCGVLGLLARVQRCVARCIALCVRCPGPLGSCSPVCPLGALGCMFGVLGHSAPVHRCARSVRCVACAVSSASWLPLSDVFARCGVSRVRCPGPIGSWSPVCVHAVCCVLRVRCPGPLASCSPVFPLDALLCLCGFLGHSAPVHRCARSVRRVVCVVSWATWLLLTGVPARCVVCRVPCPGPPGSCSAVCRSVHCVVCSVSWATWLLFTGVLAWCAVLCVQRPGPLGSCSPVCSLGALRSVCTVQGHLANVHRCAHGVFCVACSVSWATWLLFTGVHTPCLVSRVRCPGRPGSRSPVCPPGALRCFCGVLGHLAPVHRCARSLCCVVCAVTWATWLLFTDVPALYFVLRLWCPGPLGSCSPVCPLGVLRCVFGVPGHLAPVQRCARSVRCVACAVSSAS